MSSSTLKNPNSDIYQEKGTLSGEYVCYGIITSSATRLDITVFPGKLPNHISRATITALTLSGRLSTGGYVGGASGYNAFSQSSTRNVAREGSTLRIMLNKSSGTWGTNNVGFAGVVNFTMTLT